MGGGRRRWPGLSNRGSAGTGAGGLGQAFWVRCGQLVVQKNKIRVEPRPDPVSAPR